MLYIGKHLIRVPEDLKYYFLPQGTKSIAMGAFDNCFLLKKVCVPRAAAGVLSTLTNLETLVVTEMPSGGIISYFTDAAFVPLTLESVVLEQNVRMQANAFYGITDVTVYVSATQKDTMWDENFPGWNNRNKVIYGDKWIQADFYYGTGEIRSSMLYTTSQIIRVPWMGDAVQGDLVYVFLGFDIDGDGVADSIPATSANDLTARAVYAVYTKDNVCSGIGHTFDIWRELEAPNCTKGGTERRDCEYCDHYQTREIKAKGHDYTSVVTEPTCIDRGFTTYTCHCGNVLVDDYVKALDHKYGDPVTITKATCTQSGEERLDCERCDHFVKNEIPASHTYPTEGGGWTQTRVPSCTDAGEKRRDCEKCDHFETQPIGYAEHVYVPTVIAPTCTGEGYTLRTCDCGAVLVDTFVPAVGHAYGEWTITLAPSCTGSGEERRQCIHCDDTQIRTLQATGHADANADGACDVCGDGAQVDPKDPQGNSDSSSKGIVLIAAVGGGVAAAAVLCAVILAKKKKKK